MIQAAFTKSMKSQICTLVLSNAQCDPVSASASDSATTSGDAAPPKHKKAKGQGAILAAIPRENPTRKSLSLVKQFSKEQPYVQYLEQPYEESTSDPLLWWKTHETAFSHLAKLARKYLCVPATSVPSELVFNTTVPHGEVTLVHSCSEAVGTASNIGVMLAQNEQQRYIL